MRTFIAIILIAVFTGIAAPVDSHLPRIRIAHLRNDRGPFADAYPGALNSLLEHVRTNTSADVDPVPLDIADFSDPMLKNIPFVYANFADRTDWTFNQKEAENLKNYLARGGFLFIDAGINAAFLRGGIAYGQHHSYAEWEPTPELVTAFKTIFPDLSFEPVRRSDPLFRIFYAGLPDPSNLPDAVRDYTVNEKWPDGTYSIVAIKLNGRVAVIASPIIAMGWGRNAIGQWTTNIRFRILEDTQGLNDYLKNAAYSGMQFEIAREDGGKDLVFCQQEATPSWAREPNGKSRVFKYYGSAEINQFAHEFYTRLGTNILIYALTR